MSGWIEEAESTLAAYLIHWTEGSHQHDANFDLIFGRWAEAATPNDRSVASFAYRASENAFMVIEARTRPVGQSQTVAA